MGAASSRRSFSLNLDPMICYPPPYCRCLALPLPSPPPSPHCCCCCCLAALPPSRPPHPSAAPAHPRDCRSYALPFASLSYTTARPPSRPAAAARLSLPGCAGPLSPRRAPKWVPATGGDVAGEEEEPEEDRQQHLREHRRRYTYTELGGSAAMRCAVGGCSTRAEADAPA